MSKDQTAEDYRDHLTRLPQLANSMIHTNIQDQIEKLKSAPGWQQPAGRSAETLVKYANFRLVLVLMKQAGHMNDHHADGPISVQCIRGKIKMHLSDGQGVVLGAGDILALDRCVKHDVEALEESAFLLTISWQGPEAAEYH